MKVILFGATGMVGKAVLRQCLLDPEIESVLAMAGYDTCFFCLGVSSVGMSEADYTT